MSHPGSRPRGPAHVAVAAGIRGSSEAAEVEQQAVTGSDSELAEAGHVADHELARS